MLAKGMPFPAGTVVVKVLNTTASGEDVPYLRNSTTWQANGHKQLSPTSYDKCAREVREVHLVQMDLAVVDPRSPTRWVYSTLVYDGDPIGLRRRMAVFSPFTYISNASGQPALSLPLHWTADGLPVGLQILGDAWDEAAVLQVLAHLERTGAAVSRRPRSYVDVLLP